MVASVEMQTVTQVHGLKCVDCGCQFSPPGRVAIFDGASITHQESWGTLYRHTRNGPVCGKCFGIRPEIRPARDLSLHEAWEAAERAAAEWKDPDDWSTWEQQPTSREDIMTCWKESERRYLPPGSRGSNKSGKRFGKKQVGWKKPSEEAAGW